MKVYCPHCGNEFELISKHSINIADVIDTMMIGKMYKHVIGKKLSDELKLSEAGSK